MNYELAKELKDSGFPVRLVLGATQWNGERLFFDGQYTPEGEKIGFVPPTLSELMEVCGENSLFGIVRYWQGKLLNGWGALYNKSLFDSSVNIIEGSTPEEAVARLYLALHGKTN